jgi:hypothetical protein
VHVCQSWRQVIFVSPHRLDLQIRCTHGTPVEQHLGLGLWPAFPIVIDYYRVKVSFRDDENIIAALEHPDRVSSFTLQRRYRFGSELANIVTAMQEPYPLLTYLDISTKDAVIIYLFFPPNSWGDLHHVYRKSPYTAFPIQHYPRFLSTTDLVKLDLFDMPPTGYISPEATVASLATFTQARNLSHWIPIGHIPP